VDVLSPNRVTKKTLAFAREKYHRSPLSVDIYYDFYFPEFFKHTKEKFYGSNMPMVGIDIEDLY